MPSSRAPGGQKNKLRVCVVSAIYPPEPVVSARTSQDIAQGMAARGHQVQVITAFPSRPAGKLYPGYRRRWRQVHEEASGVQVVRLASAFSTESSLTSRFWENITFGLRAAFELLFSEKPDVIYANTWPIFASGLLSLAAGFRQAPLVVSVQDLYPESLVAQGRMSSRHALVRGMLLVDGWIARRAKALVVISERFAGVYREERGVAAERIRVVPNWIEVQALETGGKHVDVRKVYGIPSQAFLLVYGGNIGVAAGVETVIRSLEWLPEDAGVYLLIAGEGSRLQACRELASQLRRPVIFRSPWPAEETGAILNAADALVLPTQGSQAEYSVPSKLLAYMLAGKPVIAMAKTDSDTAQLVQRASCGWVLEPDQPDALATVIKSVQALPALEMQRRGEAGRTFALHNLIDEVNLPQVLDLLERVARGLN